MVLRICPQAGRMICKLLPKKLICTSILIAVYINGVSVGYCEPEYILSFEIAEYHIKQRSVLIKKVVNTVLYLVERMR